MFPEADGISTIISQIVKFLAVKRRLIDRVLQVWEEMAQRELPRRDQIAPSRLGVDRENCLVIAVQSPVQLSNFVTVGKNLSVHPGDNTLAGVLLSHLPLVLSERRCLMIEGRAMFRGVGVLYRGALYPLSEDGDAIDHVLGAANYRPLRGNGDWMKPLIRTKWL